MTWPAKPPMRIFTPFMSSGDLDLLAPPAAHLGTGVAHQEGGHVVFLVELAHQLEPAAVVDPGIVLARVEAERHRGVEGEGRVLADVVVGRGVAALDRLVLHGIDDLQAGHDLAGGEDADLELVVGEGRDALGEVLARAIDRVERLGEARGQAPLHSGMDWAMAGAASVPAAATAAPPTPAVRRNLRRCIEEFSWKTVQPPSRRRGFMALPRNRQSGQSQRPEAASRAVSA